MPETIAANFVDHISIAVHDVVAAEQNYVAAFGWEVAYRYEDIPEKIRVTGFMVGPTAIELMEDLDGTGQVAQFLKKRGEGVMLVSYNVDDCASSLQKLKANGISVLDQTPRHFAAYNRNFAFIHPKGMHGVLTEVIDGSFEEK